VIGEGLVGQAALTRKVVLMEPTARAENNQSRSILGNQRSLIALPITAANGELCGVLQARAFAAVADNHAECVRISIRRDGRR
jgi:putative methionine-R-sulfoxide reductase with GAF domain